MDSSLFFCLDQMFSLTTFLFATFIVLKSSVGFLFPSPRNGGIASGLLKNPYKQRILTSFKNDYVKTYTFQLKYFK
ncbi:hypothetical protein CN446_23320 [Bacillus cereus]|nr:hypothetical protein [Bacillus nitratireducens]PEW93205.1 hypothetical protein CN446_23320 [Bacillus cereus]PGU48809.1 hypothetical protein COD70_31255 [Bacillus cereus]PGW24653.1 hypothetical protein COE04_32140 [Bacillus cereus]